MRGFWLWACFYIPLLFLPTDCNILPLIKIISWHYLFFNILDARYNIQQRHSSLHFCRSNILLHFCCSCKLTVWNFACLLNSIHVCAKFYTSTMIKSILENCLPISRSAVNTKLLLNFIFICDLLCFINSAPTHNPRHENIDACPCPDGRERGFHYVYECRMVCWSMNAELFVDQSLICCPLDI